MTVSVEIRQTRLGDEFRRCTACGYGRGFHCSLIRSGGDDPRQYGILLICPNCGMRYNIGWTISIESGTDG